MLQASLQNPLRRAESAEKELHTPQDQLRQLRGAARPTVELDLHALSVQQGVDQAPRATQPVTVQRRRTRTGTRPEERKQPPPPPKAPFALDHRAAVWSPSRAGGVAHSERQQRRPRQTCRSREDKDLPWPRAEPPMHDSRCRTVARP